MFIFHCLCQKVIEIEDLNILQSEIIETLCQLEINFPPSFFVVMVHLPIHLVNELRLRGSVQFRWMYFLERYLAKLKSYVCNKSHLEGSISEGYLVEECLVMCSRYLHSGVETRLNRMTSYLNELESLSFFLALAILLEERKRVKQFLWIPSQGFKSIVTSCSIMTMSRISLGK